MYTLNQIPSNAQIQKYLRRIIFGRNVRCPRCASRQVAARQGRYHCRTCRSRFSLLSGTWLSNLKLPLPQFWLLLWCWTTQVPIRQTVSLSKRSEVTVRHWFAQFRDHLPEEAHILERIVQLDEAYFKRRALLMGKQVGTRKLAYEVIPQAAVQRHHAARFLFQKVRPGSRLWTDGAAIYKHIGQWWPVRHSRDIHKRFEFQHTSEIEGIFGVYRTFVRRMYHHHWSENLESYVREFCFRFSSPEIFENPKLYLAKSLSRVPTA